MKRLQVADKALGFVACLVLQPLRVRKLRRPTARPVERVLCIKFWGLGSLQLLTPAVRALRRRHPGARVSILTLAENRDFARRLGAFDEVLTLDVSRAGWTAIFGRILRLVDVLRSLRYDAVYDFEFFTRFSAVVSALSGARETSGFSAPSIWRGRLHTRSVPFNRYWHVARNFRCLAGGESGRAVEQDELIPFRADPDDARGLALALGEGFFEREGPLVVLNPNAGRLSLERRWPPGHFAELARRLVLEDGARVALVGSPAEAEWTGGVAALAGELPPRALANLAGRLSLGALHALLLRADLFVTNDSGPMHLAAAQGTPTLGLFGPETPVMYAPLGPRARALYRPPACSPCINVHDNKLVACHRGRAECLMNLTVEHVLEEARAELSRDGLRRLEGRPAAETAG